MEGYDPYRAPDPGEWLSADEDERILHVQRWHRKAGARVPEPRFHALLHVIVESHLADGVPAVRKALDRLVGEGLDRHDAVHAISVVLAGVMRDALERGPELESRDLEAAYRRRLRDLTAEKYRAGC